MASHRTKICVGCVALLICIAAIIRDDIGPRNNVSQARTSRTIQDNERPDAYERLAKTPTLWNGYFGDCLPNISDLQKTQFLEGQELFLKQWSPSEGLGPVFSARSCVTCHRIPLPGGAGTSADTFVAHVAGYRDPAGGTVFAKFHIGGSGDSLPRCLPSNASFRKSPSLYGLGLLESVPDSVIESNERVASSSGLGGRAVRVGQKYGRFGWKATSATLQDFIETALLSEMGLRPTRLADGLDAAGQGDDVEIEDDQVSKLASYVRFLAVPPPNKAGTFTTAGQNLFDACDCDRCHVRGMRSYLPGTQPSQAIVIHPYTDLLVHDMGPPFDDHIRDGAVSPSEFRTAPLWGIWAAGPPYLHDGRAKTLAEAIELHDGEARTAAKKFVMLSEREKSDLIEYLKSL